jgi:hypothetical protein
MFSWWKNGRSDSANELPSKGRVGTLNSRIPLTSSGEIHPSSGETQPSSGEVHPSSADLPKTVCQTNQHLAVLGTSKVTTKPTTAPSTNRASSEGAEELMRGTFELNWVLPKPLPATQSFDQDVVRVWSWNAPPARRQPTARNTPWNCFMHSNVSRV